MQKIVLNMIVLTAFLFGTVSQGMKDSKIQGRLNIVNGYSSECLMHEFYTSTGWKQIEGEIGRNGIDGLYYKTKNGQIREVLVAESKWNTSCKYMTSCNEAYYKYTQCGHTRLDGDNDGVPCENICGKR